MSGEREIRICNSSAALFESAAADFAERALAAVKTAEKFSVALSGGSTPKGMFNALAGSAFRSIPWRNIFFFWVDERHVPPDHPDSNYRMARESLLSKVPVPPQNVFRITAEESDPVKAADAYEQVLRAFFELKPGQIPRFDLILLGLGADGHTASLFPGTRGLEETQRLVTANWVEKFKTHRITLTLPVLNHAVADVFLVSGRDKAPAVRRVIEGDTESLPASLVHPDDGIRLWLLDREAARELTQLRENDSWSTEAS